MGALHQLLTRSNRRSIGDKSGLCNWFLYSLYVIFCLILLQYNIRQCSHYQVLTQNKKILTFFWPIFGVNSNFFLTFSAIFGKNSNFSFTTSLGHKQEFFMGGGLVHGPPMIIKFKWFGLFKTFLVLYEDLYNKIFDLPVSYPEQTFLLIWTSDSTVSVSKFYKRPKNLKKT